MGNDHTLFAVNTGVVKMTKWEKNRKRNVVHVLAEDGSVSNAKGFKYSIPYSDQIEEKIWLDDIIIY